jgi:hypothetical protein
MVGSMQLGWGWLLLAALLGVLWMFSYQKLRSVFNSPVGGHKGGPFTMLPWVPNSVGLMYIVQPYFLPGCFSACSGELGGAVWSLGLHHLLPAGPILAPALLRHALHVYL